ncbi:MAG: hypothetical protein JSW48_00375 [Betaproteobacteria bacterium]|nr:MAG: hypothetical protein JSW48_00375 [Betaproteobacteria bacterium]
MLDFHHAVSGAGDRLASSGRAHPQLAMAYHHCGLEVLLLIMQPWNLRASLIGKVYAVLDGTCWAIAIICAK